MTDDQINIAIAEACGWVKKEEFSPSFKDPEKMVSQGMRWHGPKSPYGQRTIPDYCHDLNAMHEAEKTLDLIGLTDFGCEIVRLVEHKESQHCPHWGRIAHATARQRSEAFLRVKGLWKEEV